MDRNQLEALWGAGKTVSEIAEETGVSHGKTNYWLKKFGLRKSAYRHNRVEESVLREMAEVQRRSRGEIADHFGVSVATVMNWARKWGVKLPKWNEWRYPDALSPKQEEFLVGTLFGDGHVQIPPGSSRSAQFYVNHGPNQREYVEWKRRLMADFLSPAYKDSCVENPDGAHFVTGAHPLFLEWKDRFYRRMDPSWHPFCTPDLEGKWTKVYTPEMAEKLTPFGLAIWYMDDGSLGGWGKEPVLTTQMFESQAKPVAQVLESSFGFQALIKPVSNDKRGWGRVFLQIRPYDTSKFFDIVRPYMITSMRYKVNPHRPYVGPPRPLRGEDMVGPHVKAWESGGTETTTPSEL